MSDTQILTREQLRAIRKAQSISFHGNSLVGRDGKLYDEHTIRAGLDRSGNDTVVEIRVNGSFGRWNHYGRRTDTGKCTGFAMISASQHSPAWRTIAGLMREGDELHLSWLADYHNNGYVNAVGLHADVLKLTIVRKSPTTGKKSEMHFEVEMGVSPDNSARMIHGIDRSSMDERVSPQIVPVNWDDVIYQLNRRDREETTA
jgi:hypothetical protein